MKIALSHKENPYNLRVSPCCWTWSMEANRAFLKWQRDPLLPNVFSSFQELFGCRDDVVRWWQRMQEVLMRKTLWWGSKQDELLMKDKKHWNPSEYVGIFLVSNTNILGTEKWVTATAHKLLSSCHDSRTSVVPWSLSPWDRVNDLSCREDKVSAFGPDPCVQRHLQMGRAIRAPRENEKHLWTLSSEKSSSPVLSPLHQKLHKGLCYKHPSLPSSSPQLHGQCWVLWMWKFPATSCLEWCSWLK